MSKLKQEKADINNCVCNISVSEALCLTPRLQEIIDRMPIMCNTYDIDFNVVDCNNKTLEVFGLSCKEEFFDNFYDFFTEYQPDGRPSVEKFKECLRVAFETGTNSFEWVDQKADGEPIESHVNLIRFQWGGAFYVVAFIQDMGLQCRVNKVNEFASAKIRHILDSLPIPCIVIDENMRISEINRNVINLFGLKSNNITFDELISEFSPKYQPDGRLSREKAYAKFKLSANNIKSDFEWMHQSSSRELLPCHIELAQFSLDEKRLMIAYIEDLRTVNKAAQLEKELNKLEHLAYTDALTGAYNRAFFMEIAEEQFQQCVVDDLPFSLIFIDADHFKDINDTFGHPVGDEVLKIIVARMRHVLKQSTLTARFGGEEFIVLLPDVTPQKAEQIAWRLNTAIRLPEFYVGAHSIPVTASLGVGFKDESTATLASVLANADMALYEAKSRGRNTVVVYSKTCRQRSGEDLAY